MNSDNENINSVMMLLHPFNKTCSIKKTKSNALCVEKKTGSILENELNSTYDIQVMENLRTMTQLL